MKKKLVFRSGSLRMGGLERVLIEVLQNIDKEKYEITLIIEDNSGEENIFLKDIPEGIKLYFLKSEEVIEKTKYHKERKKNLYHKMMYNLHMSLERKLVRENNVKIMNELGEVDVFIDFDWGAVKYIESIKAKKKIVWIHNSIPKLMGEKQSKIKRFGKRLAKYDTIVAICDEMKDEIEKIYPYLKGKVEKAYNPFNFKRIKKLSDDESDLNFEKKELMKEKYIVAVSRLDTVQKDYETLIEAFKKLKSKGIEEKLYIIGDGPDRGEIEKLILEKGVSDKVKLIGITKNPYVWMKNSEFFVHSSKYEGLPTVLIEAMILGKVVISSECPTGPKEILNSGKCGVLYPVGDSEKLSKDIDMLLKNSEMKEKYIKNSKERVLEFSTVKVMKRYDEIIEGKNGKKL